MKNIIITFTALVTLFTFTACGQKGPLYILEDQNKQEVLVEDQKPENETAQEQETVEPSKDEKAEEIEKTE